MKKQFASLQLKTFGFITAALVSSAAFATGRPLTGTYEAVDSAGCTYLSLSSAHTVSLVATDDELELNGPNQGWPTGSYTVKSGGFFNEFAQFFDGAYSTDGTQFKQTEHLIDALIPNTQGYDIGELDVVLTGNTLVINDTQALTPQFSPAPLQTCVLNKIK